MCDANEVAHSCVLAWTIPTLRVGIVQKGNLIPTILPRKKAGQAREGTRRT
jgi:hypothetical protein